MHMAMDHQPTVALRVRAGGIEFPGGEGKLRNKIGIGRIEGWGHHGQTESS